MSEKAENPSNSLDMLKWLIVIVLLGGVIAANTYYQEVSVLYRALGAVALVVLAGFLASSTVKGSTFINFAKESRTEVRKVVWPTRQEAIQTTGIVLVVTLLMSLLLWVLDSVLFWLVGLVTGLKVL